MYIGVLMVVGGWAVRAGSPMLGMYLVMLAIAFHVAVISHEEPALSRQFPSEWGAYSAGLPRWLPRLTPWRE